MKKIFIDTILMCRPTHYEIEYVINPWMQDQKIDKSKALYQWENLLDGYKKLGISIELIDQISGYPDMVFTADQGVVRGDTVLMSSFFKKERRGENDIYRNWFKSQGYKLTFLSKPHTFEGNGELLEWNNRLFVGVGFRTVNESCKEISTIFNQEVIPLKLVNPYFYHLDTCLFPLDDETVFYFPDAFDKKAQEKLSSLVPELIPFTKDQAHKFYGNSVVTHGKVFIQESDPNFEEILMKKGYELSTFDMSEFNKAGGGIHCLTNTLKYHYEL